MKKLLKNVICGSINSARYALFTEKSNIAAEKLLNSNKIGQNAWEKKSRLKRLKTQNVRLGNPNAHPKRTLKPYMDGDFN